MGSQPVEEAQVGAEPVSISMASIRHQLQQSGADPAAILRSTIHSPSYSEFSARMRAEEAHEFIEMLDHVRSVNFVTAFQ